MRNAMLIGSLLNNVETLINVTKKNENELEKPDLFFQEKLLPTKGKPSKAFRYLELGIIPVRYVIIQKRLLFLKYILNESTDSMIKQVYMQMKQDSRKGDFVDHIKRDLNELEIRMEDYEINEMTSNKWKKLVKEKTKDLAFKNLVKENNMKEKTKHIKFKYLEMSDYLKVNQRTDLSRIIFETRSGTLDLKSLQQWKYENNLCVLCELKEENMEHFMKCKEYGDTNKNLDWKDIYKNETNKQFKIAEEIKRRMKVRKYKQDAGLDFPGSQAPTPVVE